MNKKFISLFITMIVLNFPVTIYSQQSVAREWNEVLLEAIREDFARPTVHATKSISHFSGQHTGTRPTSVASHGFSEEFTHRRMIYLVA